MKGGTERAEQAFRDAAAQFVARMASPQSLITITRAEVRSDFSHAKLFFSVLPEEQTGAATALLNRSIPELKAYLKEHIRIGRMPHLEFVLEKTA